MKAAERIGVFKQLGYELRIILDKDSGSTRAGLLEELCRKATIHNAWFTEDNVIFRLTDIAHQLQEPIMDKWLSAYQLPEDFSKKTVGVIAAGNIPAAGYEDFMHTLLAGHDYMGKLSTDDKILLPFIADLIVEIEPAMKKHIHFTEGRLGSIDAVIATGSNNSSRYFDYYFGKYPNVIRKNRNSVAVLDGSETKEELQNLGEDIFRYFGLGCRNVTKLFVPSDYRFDPLYEAIFHWSDRLMQNRKYMNNYEYNRTIYMLNNEKILDNNFLVMKQDTGIASPPGVLYYEEYSSLAEVNSRLEKDNEAIQCVVSKMAIAHAVAPGYAQKPEPWDYADAFDTLEFLLKQ
jgi:hypothetical protein